MTPDGIRRGRGSGELSDDGADLGITAERALRTVLGGEGQPAEDERDTPEVVRARVMASLSRAEPRDYGDAADMAAGMVLTYFDRTPEARDWPAGRGGKWVDVETGEPWTGDPQWDRMEYRPAPGPDLYEQVKAMSEGRLSDLGLSGFQWGWAVNAAKYAVGAPPVPNPAIMTVGS